MDCLQPYTPYIPAGVEHRVAMYAMGVGVGFGASAGFLWRRRQTTLWYWYLLWSFFDFFFSFLLSWWTVISAWIDALDDFYILRKSCIYDILRWMAMGAHLLYDH
jgi:hypothetical protein